MLIQPTYTLFVALSRFAERFARRCCPGLLVLGLFAFSCQESLPTAAELPPPPSEPSPFVEHRSWTPPQHIEAAPYADPSYLLPISLSTSGTGQLHLLLRVPADTLFPPQELRLGYLFYDGGGWSLRGQLEGDGWFMPSASAAGRDGRVHLFWGGILSEERQDWLEQKIISSQLFSCLWMGTSCSTPVSLTTVPSTQRNLFFDEAMLDDQGQVHLVVSLISTTYLHTLDANGALINTTQFLARYPRILARGEKLHFIYMASSKVPGVANDLYYRFSQDGVWSEPVVTFHDVVKRGHHPALAIDDNEVYHLVFYAEAGSSSLMYTQSEDEGSSWVSPEVIHTMESFSLFKPPKLVVDRHGVLHLMWSRIGKKLPNSTIGAISYYATRREGAWSEVQELFPDYDLKAPALLTLDANDVAHVVFLALEGEVYRLYHTRFE